MSGVRLDGDVAPGFGAVADALVVDLAESGRVAGVACCVHVDGRPVVDVWGGSADPSTGRAFGPDTLQVIHTATTGAVAVVASMLLERGVLRLGDRVASHWPEFAQRDKGRITVEAVLNQQAGLTAVDARLSSADLIEVQPVVDALARQAPLWPPGTAHGYHAITFGWLVGELVRRCTGRSLGAYFADHVARPLGLEFWIGLPGAFEWRVAPLVGSVTDGAAPASRRGSLAWRSITLDGAFADHSALNGRAVHATEVPTINGIATARALSRLHAATVGEVDGTRLLSPRSVDLLRRHAVDGRDLVLGRRTRFGLGFSLPTDDWPLLGPASFGSVGMGNSLGFGDADHGLGFGYVTNSFSNALVPGTGARRAVQALARCVTARVSRAGRRRVPERAPGGSSSPSWRRSG